MGYDEDVLGEDSYLERERDSGGLPLVIGVGVILLALAGVALVFLSYSSTSRYHAQGANQSSAIGALKAISAAQTLHREGDKDNDGTLDYAADLRELGRGQLIDLTLASGTKHGYLFETHTGPQPEFQWFATADPQDLGEPGLRFFYIDQTDVVYHSERGPIQGPLDLNNLPAGVAPLGQ